MTYLCFHEELIHVLVLTFKTAALTVLFQHSSNYRSFALTFPAKLHSLVSVINAGASQFELVANNRWKEKKRRRKIIATSGAWQAMLWNFRGVHVVTKEKSETKVRNQGKKYCIDNNVDMWFATMQVSSFLFLFLLSTWKHRVICMVCMRVNFAWENYTIQLPKHDWN